MTECIATRGSGRKPVPPKDTRQLAIEALTRYQAHDLELPGETRAAEIIARLKEER